MSFRNYRNIKDSKCSANCDECAGCECDNEESENEIDYDDCEFVQIPTR